MRIAWCSSRSARPARFRAPRRASLAPAGRRRAPRPAGRTGRGPASTGAQLLAERMPAPDLPARRRARRADRARSAHRSAPRPPEVKLLQARDFTLGELRVGDIRQRATAPESERTLQRPDRLLRVTSGETPSTLFKQRRSARHPARRPRAPGHSPRRVCAAAARPRVPCAGARWGLECFRCSGGRVSSVEIFDQPVGRDDLACMEEQVREESALARASKLDRPTVVVDLQFAPQDSVLHSPAATGCNWAAAAPQPPASILAPVDRTGRSNRRRKQCRLGPTR